jgi:hypothetical protein
LRIITCIGDFDYDAGSYLDNLAVTAVGVTTVGFMPYDEDVANRIRALLANEHIVEKRMFGGLAFMIGGNMAVAASGRGGLMVRVPPDETEALLSRAYVEPMVMAGRETRGWLRVSDDGINTKRQLQFWVTRGVEYASTLSPK